MANIESNQLFAILPQNGQKPGKGIARLAAGSTALDAGHEVEFRALTVRSLLNKTVSKRGLAFSRSINPYRGCEFACRYCYARYTHEFMELRDPADFERKIFAKQNAAWLLEQELRELRPGELIAIGTATDPYQPIERKLKITRSLLEVLAARKGLRIGLVTKSTLIVRDIDVLERIAARSALTLHLTITTPDAKLARILEPRAPRPDLRFKTVARLRKAGLRAGILCSPLLPGLTDTLEALDGMAQRAKAVDACFLAASPLFLKPCSRETYLAFSRENFPALESLYRFRFDGRDFVTRAYSKRIQKLVHSVVVKYGLGRRYFYSQNARTSEQADSKQDEEQMTLWPEAKQPSSKNALPIQRNSGAA
jgi:DNA repair photolyase